MKTVKKVLNVEYDLSSADFIAQKQDQVSQEYQDRHPNDLVKVTTFCVPDKAIVVSTTQENVDFMGAADKMLATRPLEDQSLLTLDDEMLKTYEITITAGTDLPDYVTAINIAQAKADEMFKADDSKIPLVTVIDYRWGNVPATVSATLFGGLIDANNSSSTVVVGDAEAGENYVPCETIYKIKVETTGANNGYIYFFDKFIEGGDSELSSVKKDNTAITYKNASLSGCEGADTFNNNNSDWQGYVMCFYDGRLEPEEGDVITLDITEGYSGTLNIAIETNKDGLESVTIKCYNSDDELIKEITDNDLARYGIDTDNHYKPCWHTIKGTLTEQEK